MDRKLIGHRIPVSIEDQTFWLGRALEAQQSAPTEEPSMPEPRHSVRRPYGLEALVNHGMTYSTPWRVRDLSLTGAFVEMDPLQLPEGSDVEFVLRYRYQGKSFEHRMPATVTRVHPDGVGLTFGQYDDDTYTQLTNLLYAI